MKSVLFSALLLVFGSGFAQSGLGQECVNCRTFEQIQVFQAPVKVFDRPTLAPALPVVKHVVATPVRVVANVPQVVRQLPVVKHVGHGHLVSILERPVAIVRRTVSVPVRTVSRVSHKLRFGCH